VSQATVDVEPEVSVRAGFGPVAPQLRQAPCPIAYLGASVTVQKEGYRPRLHELIRRRFGQQHASLFAGVGATGVLSAVFLTDELVASHRPALCFVEYSTPLPERRDVAEASSAIDGIIAKLLSVGCQPCLLHLYRRGEAQDQIVGMFEDVAARHGIPSIDLVTPLRAAVDGGRLDKHWLLRDGIHTTPEGSQLVAEMADVAVARIVDAGGPGARLIAPPAAPSYRQAHQIAATLEDVSGDTELALFRLHRPYVRIKRGSRVRRRFDGSLHGLAVVIGPESGEVEISAGGESQRRMLFDPSSHYERFGTVLLPNPVPAGIETTISLTKTKPDYSISKQPIEPPPEQSLQLFGYLVAPA
jgi:hypothetical protein